MAENHECDENCVCPVHKTPLIYSPSQDDHACQDGECPYGSGGANPMRVGLTFSRDPEIQDFHSEAMLDMDRAKALMANYSPAMLVHMSQWCTRRARDKTLTPEDASFRPLEEDPDPR